MSWVKGVARDLGKPMKLLGDGFKYFLFSSLPGEMIRFDEYFSDGLVQPPTRLHACLEKTLVVYE